MESRGRFHDRRPLESLRAFQCHPETDDWWLVPWEGGGGGEGVGGGGGGGLLGGADLVEEVGALLGAHGLDGDGERAFFDRHVGQAHRHCR